MEILGRPTPHPTLTGIYQYIYRVPKRTRDGKPIEGQFHDGVRRKTVYDSDIISDSRIAELSELAAQRAQFEKGKRQADVEVDSYRFRVYLDQRDGSILNSHLIYE